jgi:hypothetical protein
MGTRKQAGETKVVRKFVAVYKPGEDALFHIHAAGCADLAKAEQELKTGRVSGIEPVYAESPEAAARVLLTEDFSGPDGTEHPAANGYPGGSYGAAGFTYHVLSCCGRLSGSKNEAAAGPDGRAVLPRAKSATRAEKSKMYRATLATAVAAGFAPGIEVNAPGFWKALRVFCAAKAIAGPWVYALKTSTTKAKAPTAAQKREAKLARKREAEKARRLRIKAAKAGRK